MQLLQTPDWIVVAGYFVLVFAVAFGAARREKSTLETSTGYFLAGRHAGWFVIGASLFASNIGAEHIVGLAGSGAAGGVAVGQFEILASLVLLLLGWVFVPFYLKSGVFTMPEFLERRYSESARWYLALISIIGYVITKISVTIAAGGIIFESLMGVNFWTGAIIVIVATGIYTIFGGLQAVLYTDLLQMFVLIGGAATVTLIGLSELGGWEMMVDTAGGGFFNLWKPMSDPDFPWTGIVFGAPILGVWYWCTDQFIVQRVLSARDENHARRGTIFGGIIKQLPLFIFVIPGIIAYCLSQTGRLHFAENDQALPTLIGVLLPTGFRGLVVAGLIAALMSSLSSVFNSTSTLFTLDIYKKLHPDAPEKLLVRVGQIATLVLVGLGLAWIPLIKLISGQLFVYIQSVQAYISPPIAAVFLVGILWRRVNARGAIVSLITGFVLGMGRLVTELNKESLNGWLFEYADINFLHFASFLFVICTAVLILVSLTAPPPDEKHWAGITIKSAGGGAKAAQPVGEPKDLWRRRDAWGSIALVLIVAAIWVYFTG
jgi:SSS family solute:Na+ symporter